MSLLPNLGSIGSGVSNFYKGVATTSVRLNKPDSSYLVRTPSTASNRRTWTWSGWFKTTTLSVDHFPFFSCGASASSFTMLFIEPTNDRIAIYDYDGTTDYGKHYNVQIRDPSAWYHIQYAVDTTQSTASDRLKVYLNGTQLTTPYATEYGDMPLNYETEMNYTTTQHIGKYVGNSKYADGYLSDVNFVDGTQLAPTSFGETKNGVWIAKEYTGSYGTNGYRLKFKSSDFNESGSAVTDPYGSSTNVPDDDVADASGSGNHFSVSGLVTSDFGIPDSPENNFNTQNPVSKGTYTFAKGNLKISRAGGTGQSSTIGTISVPSGKWYWEVKLISGQSDYPRIGMFNTAIGNNHIESKYPADNDLGARVWGSAANGSTNKLFGDSNAEAAFGSYDDGDVLQFALDMDNFKMYMGKNDTWYTNSSTTTDKANISDSSANPAFGSATNLDINAGDSFTPCIFSNANADVWIANFGQDPSFAGGLTGTDVGDETPSEGAGLFKYAPPSGYLALCTANLPDTTIGPNSTTQADNHFGILTWSGDDGATRKIATGESAVTGTVDFTPDWSWIKRRNGASNGSDHLLLDIVRGVDAFNGLSANATQAEGLTAAGSTWVNFGDINNFETGGFTVQKGTDGSHTLEGINQSGGTYVGWNWKAGGEPTATNSAGAGNTPTAGSVKIDGVNLGSALAGTIPATKISANTTSGFSIVTYTGTGTAGTIAHGLGAIPNMYMVKCLDNSASSDHWYVYHAGIASNAEDYEIYLNLTARAYENNNYPWNETKPTNSVFSIKTLQDVNQSSKLYVAYCFAEVEGYSKFGKYLANGSGGEFVYLGFRPAWVMIKEITSGSTQWLIFDSTRAPFNMIDDVVLSTTIQVEGFSSGMELDFLSNGFKIRGSNNDISYSGKTHIYMAFAEAPFKYANAR